VAFEPTVSVDPIAPNRTISARTNFPDGTALTLFLYRRESRYVNEVNVVVSEGRFRAANITNSTAPGNAPMSPGTYRLTVMNSIERAPDRHLHALMGLVPPAEGPNVIDIVCPTFALRTSITVPGQIDRDSDAKYYRASRDQETTEIGAFCQWLYGREGDYAVKNCIAERLKKIDKD
jgi:hypothetical protein